MLHFSKPLYVGGQRGKISPIEKILAGYATDVGYEIIYPTRSEWVGENQISTDSDTGCL